MVVVPSLLNNVGLVFQITGQVQSVSNISQKKCSKVVYPKTHTHTHTHTHTQKKTTHTHKHHVFPTILMIISATLEVAESPQQIQYLKVVILGTVNFVVTPVWIEICILDRIY